jgi:hypothetical protein
MIFLLLPKKTREARYGAVRAILEDNIKLRDKAEDRFQSFFEREVHRLHNDVRTESEVIYRDMLCFSCMEPCMTFWIFLVCLFTRQVREREDDEIIEALNRYTLKLQNSLKIVNSTDM